MTGQRASEICAHIMALSEERSPIACWGSCGLNSESATRISGSFSGADSKRSRPYLLSDRALSEERSLLIGGYFTHEYSFEAAALFNPSIVPHPDQSNLAAGSQRFVLSLRATGEGHISSITFRSGTVDSNGNIGDRRAHPLQPGAGARA